MKPEWFEEEQQDLSQVITEIQVTVERLEQKRARPSNSVEAQLDASRTTKIITYLAAIDSPYFGKLDLLENGVTVQCRIGKHGIANDDFDQIVYDWQSSLGDVYYSFSGGNGAVLVKTPGGPDEFLVRKKRIVHIEKSEVQNVREQYSELYPLPEAGEVNNEFDESNDPILNLLLKQRETDHQLKEIIATIQKEQNEVIRLGLGQPVLVQGVAGSGKTSIALHRVSYLLYHYQEQLRADKFMVLAPNQLFLNYMKNIVQELDIEGIQSSTISNWIVQLVPFIKSVRPAQFWLEQALMKPEIVSEWQEPLRFKTSIAFYESVNQYMEQLAFNFLPQNFPQVSFFGEQPLNVGEEFRKIYDGYRHLPLNERRAETLKSIQSWMQTELTRQRQILESRYKQFHQEWLSSVHDSITLKNDLEKKMLELVELKCNLQTLEWQGGVQAYLDGWARLNLWQVYRELHQLESLQKYNPEISEAIQQKLDEWAEQAWKQRKEQSAYEDLGLLLFLEQRITGLKADRLDYLMIDEAQDYYPFLLRVIRELTKSLTLLGDVTQSICSWTGLSNWDSIDDMLLTEVHRTDLTVSYRSTMEIMEVANHILQHSKLGVDIIHSVKRNGPQPEFIRIFSYEDLIARLKQSIEDCMNKGYAKIAVVVKDPDLCHAFYSEFIASSEMPAQFIGNLEQALEEKLIFIPATLVKGLEFEAVIIPSTYGESELDARLLFVSVTRAQDALLVLYHDAPGNLLPIA